jgi:preprotein translocase subunit Sec61beta
MPLIERRPGDRRKKGRRTIRTGAIRFGYREGKKNLALVYHRLGEGEVFNSRVRQRRSGKERRKGEIDRRKKQIPIKHADRRHYLKYTKEEAMKGIKLKPGEKRIKGRHTD